MWTKYDGQCSNDAVSPQPTSHLAAGYLLIIFYLCWFLPTSLTAESIESTIALVELDEMEHEGTELVEAYDYLFKFIVIGEAGTGKSCLLYHCINEQFKENSAHTIGVEFSSRTLRIGDRNIKLQLWDTAGQERFRSVTRSYYRGAAGAVLVYDITSRQTFVNLSRWLTDCKALASPHLVVALVGNKLDKEEDREVEYAEGSRWAQENGLLFVEVSSMTGENVTTPFLLAGRAILSAIDAGTLDPDSAGTGVSYGERQLRSVGSSSRLSTAFGSTARRRGRRDSVSLKDMVGAGRRCSC